MPLRIEEQVSRRIVVEVCPVFGPQAYPVRLIASLDDRLGSIRRAISNLYRFGIHTEVVLVSRGKELRPESDASSLRQLGIGQGRAITVGLRTPPLPLYAGSCYKAGDVSISKEAVKKCFDHVKKHPKVEVAGVLLGHEAAEEGEVSIKDSAPISEGNSASVTLSPVETARLAENLRGQENYIVGWYHSHVKSEQLSNIDLRLQSAYQRIYAKAVAMVLDGAKGSVSFYRVKDVWLPPMREHVYLNMPEPKVLSMESDVVTLTTVLEEKESAEMISFDAHDVEAGQPTTFTAMVKNAGTVELRNIQLHVFVTSPDNRETLPFYSEVFDLLIGESKTVSVEGRTPTSWPAGNAIVRAGLINMDTRNWLFRGSMTAIKLTQPPIYDVKLRVLQTYQKVRLAQTVTYTISVKNNGNRQDNVEISWERPQASEWDIRVYDGQTVRENPFTITLDPGASRRLILTVTAPPSGKGGMELPITLRAKSLDVTKS